MGDCGLIVRDVGNDITFAGCGEAHRSGLRAVDAPIRKLRRAPSQIDENARPAEVVVRDRQKARMATSRAGAARGGVFVHRDRPQREVRRVEECAGAQ